MHCTRGIASALLASCTLVVASCSMTTETQQQLAGAGIGAATGGAIGAAASGGNPRAVTSGAGSGAVAGWGSVKLGRMACKHTQSAQHENSLQGWKMGHPARVKLRSLVVRPDPADPGSETTIALTYGISGPRDSSIAVRETIEVRDPRNNVVIPAQPIERIRTPGGWESPRTLPLPRNAPAGTYQIIARVEGGTSHDEAHTTLTVQ
jgi:hypothetical protein